MPSTRDETIYIAGHRGMVGSAIVRRLQALGYANLITATHTELDLTDQAAVRAFAYILTPAGIAQKMAMTGRFLMRKMEEYEALKAEIAALKAEVSGDQPRTPGATA